MEFNFINPCHITAKFDTVVNMGEEFETNMFGGGQSFTPHAPSWFTTDPLPPSIAPRRSK